MRLVLVNGRLLLTGLAGYSSSNALMRYDIKGSNTGDDRIKLYTKSNQYYCGIDLHNKMQNLYIFNQQANDYLAKLSNKHSDGKA